MRRTLVSYRYSAVSGSYEDIAFLWAFVTDKA